MRKREQFACESWHRTQLGAKMYAKHWEADRKRRRGYVFYGPGSWPHTTDLYFKRMMAATIG